MERFYAELEPCAERERSLMRQTSWVEIDLAALRRNIREIRRYVGDKCQILAVVKANAYGHGVLPCAKLFLEEGAQKLAVSNIFEALEIRRGGIDAPLMILSELLPAQIATAVDNNIIQTVFSLNTAELISDTARKKGKQVKIHIKVDSGMARIGFLPERAAANDIKRIFALPNLKIEGLFSHFADADAEDKSFALRQLDIFNDFYQRLRKEGLDFPLLHMANSAALIDLPQSHMSMVRPGIILYGCYSSERVCKNRLSLKPALALKALITNVKRLPAGTSIGYSRHWRCSKESLIATVQLGYGDGFLRSLSLGARPLVKGIRVPIAGNICMDQMMLDVSDIPQTAIGDCAVFIGEQNGNSVHIDELAVAAGTVNYELACLLGLRLPKVFLN